jgi:hypothetical protein
MTPDIVARIPIKDRTASELAHILEALVAAFPEMPVQGIAGQRRRRLKVQLSDDDIVVARVEEYGR